MQDAGSPGMFLRRAQRQRQRVQAALFGGPEFGFQRGMDGTRPGDAVDAVERGADQQDAVVRLAAGLGTGVAGMAGAVVLDLQDGGREGAGEDVIQARGRGAFAVSWRQHNAVAGGRSRGGLPDRDFCRACGKLLFGISHCG